MIEVHWFALVWPVIGSILVAVEIATTNALLDSDSPLAVFHGILTTVLVLSVFAVPFFLAVRGGA